MSEFIKDKLHVYFRDGVDKYGPIIPRCYTLTHSDITGELFLDIGRKHAYEKITSIRDEALGEWGKLSSGYVFKIDLHVDGPIGNGNIEIRDMILRKELPLALKAMVYGDRELIMGNKELKKASILVNFNSLNEIYNKVEYWGEVSDYLDLVNGKRNKEIEGDDSDFRGNKDELILTLLNKPIEDKIAETYGVDTEVCIMDTQLINIKEIEKYNNCSGKYSITVGVRIAYNIDPHNNFIITFKVDKNNIEVDSIKQYRNDFI